MASRWLRSRVGTRALILGYHRIASVDADPHRLAVHPANFAEQLEVLRTKACPMSLRGLVSRLRGGDLPERAVALTFDDGYADVLHVARPLLERHGVPATVFVTTGNPGGKFGWDELGTPQASSSETADTAPDSDEYGRALTSAELRLLGNGSLLEIGAHTVSHPALAELSEARQIREVGGSKSYLEDLLGVPVVGFSYPHGSLSQHTARIVRNAGFHFACCSRPDVVRSDADPFELPRFWIPDCNGEAFSRWLATWLTVRSFSRSIMGMGHLP